MPTPSLSPTTPSSAEPLECAHCGTLVAPRAALFLEGRAYCCDGCRTVAEIVHAGGWDEFYRKRDGFSPRPEDQAATAAFDTRAFTESRVRTLEDGSCEVDLQIQGLRCAACTWLVERAVGDLDGIAEVAVSYGSGRARIRYSPDQVKLSRVAEQVSRLGYKALASDTARKYDPELIARAGIAAFASMNVMLLAVAVYSGWFGHDGMEERHAALFRFTSLMLATPAVTYSADVFFKGAWQGLRHRILSMDVPIALAIAIMYAHGVVMTFSGQDAYLDSLTMLIALLLGGRLLEASGRARAHDAAAAVLASAPTTAQRVRDGRIEEIAAEDLRVGDRVVVGTGGIVPADARVELGQASVDLSLLTGESEPVSAERGRELPAGAIVREGSIELVTTAIGEQTLLASMARRVIEARDTRPRVERIPDRLAPWFTGITLLVASGTFAYWWSVGGTAAALPATIAVLVVACPCALALATPTALSVGIAAAARRGAWVRDADVLLELAKVDAVAVDKTGTLTEGAIRVIEADDAVLRVAAAVERGSSHPLARAIRDEAVARRIPIEAADDVRETPGVGIEGRVDGHQVRVGAVPGGTGVWIDDVLAGVIRTRDRIRREAASVLKRFDAPVTMLSGDQAAEAERVAQQAGGIPFEAAMSPDQKAAWVQAQRYNGRHVLFAGDGLNDAPAIAAANVGVAMGSGAMATLLASDIVVLTPSVEPVVEALRAGRITVNTLRVLTAISATYNISAVCAAACGLVNPLVAAILMPISSLTVVLGSLSIERRMRHGHHRRPAPAVVADGLDLRGALRPRSA